MRRLMAGGLTGFISLAMVACGSESATAGTADPAPTTVTSASPTFAASGPSNNGATPPAMPALFATGCGNGVSDLSGPLTGTWRADDGGVYYLRQAGRCLWWMGTSYEDLDESGGSPGWGWANVAVGRIVDDTIYLEWGDVLGEFPGRGTLTLQVSDDGDHIDKIDELVPDSFGGSSWDRLKPQPSASAP